MTGQAGASKVLGEEAHIEGEAPGSPRYNASQSEAERRGVGNIILLCPNHHVEVDSDVSTWTVFKLLTMKAEHEAAIRWQRQFPDFHKTIKDAVERYERPVGETPAAASDSSTAVILRVDARAENGLDTGCDVMKGQKVSFVGRGLITYDGTNYANPEGVLCDALGLPLFVPQADGSVAAVVWPHPDACKTDDGHLGRIGALFGWVGDDRSTAFHIGAGQVITMPSNGRLHLAVNDAVGTYADNDGEFRVDVDFAPEDRVG